MKIQDGSLLLPIIMIGLLYYPDFRTEIYMTLTVFMFCWTFFHKFPSFVLSGYKKPLYFEDLLVASPKYVNDFLFDFFASNIIFHIDFGICRLPILLLSASRKIFLL